MADMQRFVDGATLRTLQRRSLDFIDINLPQLQQATLVTEEIPSEETVPCPATKLLLDNIKQSMECESREPDLSEEDVNGKEEVSAKNLEAVREETRSKSPQVQVSWRACPEPDLHFQRHAGHSWGEVDSDDSFDSLGQSVDLHTLDEKAFYKPLPTDSPSLTEPLLQHEGGEHDTGEPVAKTPTAPPNPGEPQAANASLLDLLVMDPDVPIVFKQDPTPPLDPENVNQEQAGSLPPRIEDEDARMSSLRRQLASPVQCRMVSPSFFMATGQPKKSESDSDTSADLSPGDEVKPDESVKSQIEIDTERMKELMKERIAPYIADTAADNVSSLVELRANSSQSRNTPVSPMMTQAGEAPRAGSSRSAADLGLVAPVYSNDVPDEEKPKPVESEDKPVPYDFGRMRFRAISTTIKTVTPPNETADPPKDQTTEERTDRDDLSDDSLDVMLRQIDANVEEVSNCSQTMGRMIGGAILDSSLALEDFEPKRRRLEANVDDVFDLSLAISNGIGAEAASHLLDHPLAHAEMGSSAIWADSYHVPTVTETAADQYHMPRERIPEDLRQDGDFTNANYWTMPVQVLEDKDIGLSNSDIAGSVRSASAVVLTETTGLDQKRERIAGVSATPDQNEMPEQYIVKVEEIVELRDPTPTRDTQGSRQGRGLLDDIAQTAQEVTDRIHDATRELQIVGRRMPEALIRTDVSCLMSEPLEVPVEGKRKRDDNDQGEEAPKCPRPSPVPSPVFTFAMPPSQETERQEQQVTLRRSRSPTPILRRSRSPSPTRIIIRGPSSSPGQGSQVLDVSVRRSRSPSPTPIVIMTPCLSPEQNQDQGTRSRPTSRRSRSRERTRGVSPRFRSLSPREQALRSPRSLSPRSASRSRSPSTRRGRTRSRSPVPSPRPVSPITQALTSPLFVNISSQQTRPLSPQPTKIPAPTDSFQASPRRDPSPVPSLRRTPSPRRDPSPVPSLRQTPSPRRDPSPVPSLRRSPSPRFGQESDGKSFGRFQVISPIQRNFESLSLASKPEHPGDTSSKELPAHLKRMDSELFTKPRDHELRRAMSPFFYESPKHSRSTSPAPRLARSPSPVPNLLRKDKVSSPREPPAHLKRLDSDLFTKPKDHELRRALSPMFDASPRHSRSTSPAPGPARSPSPAPNHQRRDEIISPREPPAHLKRLDSDLFTKPKDHELRRSLSPMFDASPRHSRSTSPAPGIARSPSPAPKLQRQDAVISPREPPAHLKRLDSDLFTKPKDHELRRSLSPMFDASPRHSRSASPAPSLQRQTKVDLGDHELERALSPMPNALPRRSPSPAPGRNQADSDSERRPRSRTRSPRPAISRSLSPNPVPRPGSARQELCPSPSLMPRSRSPSPRPGSRQEYAQFVESQQNTVATNIRISEEDRQGRAQRPKLIHKDSKDQSAILERLKTKYIPYLAKKFDRIAENGIPDLGYIIDDRDFINSLDALRRAPYFVGGALLTEYSYMRDVYQQIVEHPPIFRTFKKLLEMMFHLLTTGTASVPDVGFVVAGNLFTILINGSDTHEEFSKMLCDQPGLLELLIWFVKRVKNIPIKKDVKENRFVQMMLTYSINVLYNCAMHDVNRKRLQEVGTVEACLNYLESPNELVQRISLLSVAYLADEKQSEIFQAKTKPIQHFVDQLRTAIEEGTARLDGWGKLELIKGLGRLSVNDSNKRVIADCGAIDVLCQAAQDDASSLERQESLKVLWLLCFDKTIKELLKNNAKAMAFFERMSDNDLDPKSQKVANGILWTIRDSLQHHPDAHTDGQLHIMISYQWDAQQLALRLRDTLRANGYKVWMDVDELQGSTIDAMAKAVEMSAVFLMCMSQKYKESQNCRSEAEYAYYQKKDIVPIVVQTKYKPDGWLGFLRGTKMYYDITNGDGFQVKLNDLIKALGNKGKPQMSGMDKQDFVSPQQPALKAILAAPQPPALERTRTPVTPRSVGSPRCWSDEKVATWMDAHGINRDRVGLLTGRQISFLQKMKRDAPDFYYSYVTKNLYTIRHTDFTDVSALTSAIDELDIAGK